MGEIIEPIVARGVFATYGYFVADEDSGRALLVDPGAQPELFARVAERKGWGSRPSCSPMGISTIREPWVLC